LAYEEAQRKNAGKNHLPSAWRNNCFSNCSFRQRPPSEVKT
jgi:hypothetical protein